MPAEPQVIRAQVDRPIGFSERLLSPAMLFRIGLFLLVALYARSLSFDFVYDDLHIPLSPWNQSWHGVVSAFTSDIFGAQGQVASSYYRPMSAAVGVAVARLTPATPPWFHLFTLLLAVMLYTACFLFARTFFEDPRFAAVTALLFALHPTKVETMAWIGSGLCDTQAAIYFFATLTCYLQWWRSRKIQWIAGSVVFFLLAMFTKETMIVIPALIALHAWLRSGQGKRLATTAKVVVPLVAVATFYGVVRHAMLGALPQDSIAIRPTFTMANVWSAPSALWWYIKLLVAPFGLAVLHDWTAVTGASFASFVLPLVGAIILLAVLSLVWKRTRSWRLLWLSAFFALTLAPVVALSPSVTIHDRYLQLPSFAFCALLAYGLFWWARKPGQQGLAVAAAVLVLASYAAGTWYEMGFWDNSVSLWQRAVQVAPHSVNARVELARLYAAQDVNAAVRELDEGIKLLPDSPGLWRMRGLLLFNADRLQDSRESLLRALAVSQRFAASPSTEPPDVKFGRAACNFFLAQIATHDGNFEEANQWLRAALNIAPSSPVYLKAMAENLHALGRDGEAQPYQQRLDELDSARLQRR